MCVSMHCSCYLLPLLKLSYLWLLGTALSWLIPLDMTLVVFDIS